MTTKTTSRSNTPSRLAKEFDAIFDRMLGLSHLFDNDELRVMEQVQDLISARSETAATPDRNAIIELRSAALALLQAWNRSESGGINIAELTKIRQRVHEAIKNAAPPASANLAEDRREGGPDTDVTREDAKPGRPGAGGAASAPSATQRMKTALEEFKACGGYEETDPVERLRFFCSCAIKGQDWLDVEPFFDALKETGPDDRVDDNLRGPGDVADTPTPRTDALARMVVDANPHPLGAAALQEYEAIPAEDARQLERELAAEVRNKKQFERDWLEACDQLQAARSAPSATQQTETPIPMLLFCPRCSEQHIDAPEPKSGWTNPPHATHTCKHCGLLWRPSNHLTEGVARIYAQEEKHLERIAASFPSATQATADQPNYSYAKAVEYAKAMGVLERLRQWDMLDVAGDGPHWKKEIDAVLAPVSLPSSTVASSHGELRGDAPTPRRGKYTLIDIAQLEAMQNELKAARSATGATTANKLRSAADDMQEQYPKDAAMLRTMADALCL